MWTVSISGSKCFNTFLEKMNKKRIWGALISLLGIVPLVFSQSRVAETAHNLSVTGPGEFKSLDETEICIFCHTPHVAIPRTPLWNHELSAAANYRPYRSSTLDAEQFGGAYRGVDGSSRLCLGCHDGTVALGALVARAGQRQERGRMGVLPPGSKGHIGTDLSGAHPISFAVSPALIAANNAKDTPLRTLGEMTRDPKVKLDADMKIQCTACHNPHSDENFGTSGIHFWAKPAFEEVCIVCHIY